MLYPWNDPTGNILITLNKMVSVALPFFRPSDGSDPNKNFLNAFQVSWVNMVTAGYREFSGGKSGKLGTLTPYIGGC
jgi:hypothetical protein